MPTVPVNVSDAAYDVIVESASLARAGELIAKVAPSTRVAVVTDSNVAAHHLEALKRSLNTEVVTALLPPGEDHKTVATLSLIYDQLLPAKLDRNTPLIALGGGVIGDMAGFAAATLLRGLPFIQIPTTLLAMVDASVGGKTGVNHATGKNLIGAFHQPKLVIADPTTLVTLPAREFIGGLAECVKHDILGDGEHFAALERDAGAILSRDLPALTNLVAHNVAIKARIVAADPHEHGVRAHLNLGHTFGHAIEKVSKFSYSHGEAVSFGLVAACRAATRVTGFPQADADRVVALLKTLGLPTRGLTLDVDAVVAAMIYDKKVAAGKVRFVLPTRIGEVVIRDDVPAEVVREAVESLATHDAGTGVPGWNQ